MASTPPGPIPPEKSNGEDGCPTPIWRSLANSHAAVPSTNSSFPSFRKKARWFSPGNWISIKCSSPAFNPVQPLIGNGLRKLSRFMLPPTLRLNYPSELPKRLPNQTEQNINQHWKSSRPDKNGNPSSGVWPQSPIPKSRFPGAPLKTVDYALSRSAVFSSPGPSRIL